MLSLFLKMTLQCVDNTTVMVCDLGLTNQNAVFSIKTGSTTP